MHKPSILRCPETKSKLIPLEAGAPRLQGLEPVSVLGGRRFVEHPTDRMLFSTDFGHAYPVVDGFPILLSPEKFGPKGHAICYDLRDDRFAEAYEEMEHYNRVASLEAKQIHDSKAFGIVEPLKRALERDGTLQPPQPHDAWLDCAPDCRAQQDALSHISPVRSKRVLQVGGKGTDVVRFLLAGAREGWLISPMLGELECGRALAEAVGVGDRFHGAACVAEELPFQERCFDIIYGGGTLHHTVLELSLPEFRRVMVKGGRLAATEPWKAPLYHLGTKVFGKRERNVYCTPLEAKDLEHLHRVFPESSAVHHGAMTRYPLIALGKLGVPVGLRTHWFFQGIDDRLANVLRFRRLGSSLALLAQR